MSFDELPIYSHFRFVSFGVCAKLRSAETEERSDIAIHESQEYIKIGPLTCAMVLPVVPDFVLKEDVTNCRKRKTRFIGVISPLALSN